jgi:hypothetical protein
LFHPQMHPFLPIVPLKLLYHVSIFHLDFPSLLPCQRNQYMSN